MVLLELEQAASSHAAGGSPSPSFAPRASRRRRLILVGGVGCRGSLSAISFTPSLSPVYTGPVRHATCRGRDARWVPARSVLPLRSTDDRAVPTFEVGYLSQWKSRAQARPRSLRKKLFTRAQIAEKPSLMPPRGFGAAGGAPGAAVASAPARSDVAVGPPAVGSANMVACKQSANS